MIKTILYRSGFILMLSMILTACGPSEKELAEIPEQKRIVCLDRSCENDIVPDHQPDEVVLKLNGQWFVGPQEYFSSSARGEFEWWNHKPIGGSVKRPPEMQALAVDGKGYDFSIEMMFRSTNLLEQPFGYRLIQLAEKNDWIAERKMLRPGLEAITMKHVLGPRQQYFDQVTYYVATELKGIDGDPPVAGCSHGHPMNGGGSAFFLQPGILVGIRMNQKHCADWPEIFQEITRVLALLKKVSP